MVVDRNRKKHRETKPADKTGGQQWETTVGDQNWETTVVDNVERQQDPTTSGLLIEMRMR